MRTEGIGNQPNADNSFQGTKINYPSKPTFQAPAPQFARKSPKSRPLPTQSLFFNGSAETLRNRFFTVSADPLKKRKGGGLLWHARRVSGKVVSKGVGGFDPFAVRAELAID
jgi:hypothetical protein